MNGGRSRRVRSVVLAALLLVGCSTAPRPFMGSPERGQMRAHFDLAVEMREHAVHGDLERFRTAAGALADLDPAPDLSPEVILQLGPMRWEAGVGASARSTEAAAEAAAKVARTCGDCHRANDVTLSDRSTVTPPSPEEDSNRHMNGLAWVTSLLWQGLVTPSEAAWAVGAEALTDSGALPDELLDRLPPRDVQVASDRLQDLGRDASGATDAGARAGVLGEIWATCSACHATSR